jgi:hypothetical protein
MTEITETTPEVTTTPELEEKRYEYQPTDENNIPMGGPQVIKYKTTEELIQKLQENNVRLQRKLREANRKNKTGQLDTEEIPDTAPRFSEPLDFIPEELSADDLIAITQDITNPAKVREAYRRLAKAEYGATPDQIREAIQASQKAANDARIAREVDGFLMHNPDYYICRENWTTICNWIDRYKLEPTEENFAMAYKRLSEADILLTGGGTLPTNGIKPVTQVVAPAIEQVVPAEQTTVNPGNYDDISNIGGSITAVTAEEVINFDPSVSVPQQVQRVATSLTNSNTSVAAPPPPVPGSDITYTTPQITDSKGRVTNPSRTFVGLKAIDAMPPDEYERRFRGEPGFAAKVDKLLSSKKVNPNQR